MQNQVLTHQIIGYAMKVYNTLGPGFLESVYQNALIYELSQGGLPFTSQHPIDVYYEGVRVGHFVADIWVANEVMVELKAIQSLAPAHEVQLVNYLTATGVDIGLLINFGGPSLEFKRKYRLYRPS